MFAVLQALYSGKLEFWSGMRDKYYCIQRQLLKERRVFFDSAEETLLSIAAERKSEHAEKGKCIGLSNACRDDV